MGKHGFLTPKAIGNRIKSKGLQKLRWFCQMCQKQCRDENGFKCHCTSESHQRQMLLFAENPDQAMDAFSKEFEEGFLDTLSRHHGTKRTHCNIVYNEVIADKQHVHMNSTKWTTLTSFIQYLGRAGKCVVDETEKGWYLSFIDRDPAAVKRQQEAEKRKKAELHSEERHQKQVAEMVAAAAAAANDRGEEAVEATELKRSNEEDKVSLKLSAAASAAASKKGKAKPGAFSFASALQQKEEPGEGGGATSGSSKGGGSKRGRSALEAMMEEDKKKRRLQDDAAHNRKDYWLARDIVVKVLAKKLAGGRYYKQKGVVTRVLDKYTGEVEMLQGGDVLRLDQDKLETVIPSIGGNVLVLNGVGRGEVGELVSMDVDKFCVSIKLQSGPERARILEGVQYEDACKISADGYKTRMKSE